MQLNSHYKDTINLRSRKKLYFFYFNSTVRKSVVNDTLPYERIPQYCIKPCGVLPFLGDESQVFQTSVVVLLCAKGRILESSCSSGYCIIWIETSPAIKLEVVILHFLL